MYKIFFIFLGVTLGLLACSQKSYDVKYKKGDKPLYVKHPATKFAIMSDLHFYDTILGKEGKAFEDYIDNDRKLLIESEEILDKAIEKIAAEDVDFVIIPGDLTKDGEEINHKKVSEKLAKLKQSGKKVFVINGNHDLLNGHSFRYVNDSKERVETTDREEFMAFYKDFGFGDAIDQDKESLSYVFEPVEGLWFLAMDSCMWYKNDLDEEPVVDGEFRQSTVTWIESVLQKAKSENKALLGMMHHGALEHYNSNEKYYGEYVVNRNEKIANLFGAYGLNFVFTGHFHSQDIVSKKLKNGSFLYDIETGSLVTHPCPYRIINISEDGKMTVKSRVIDEISSVSDFQTHAHKYVIEGTIKMATTKLKKFGVPDCDILNISSQVAEAYSAHLIGDENPPEITVNKKGLKLWSKIVIGVQKDLINGWWHDLAPRDNEIVIDMKTGNF